VKRRQFARVGAGLVLAPVAGVFSGARAQQPAPPELAEVVIVDYQFKPARLVVKAGTTVRWTNQEKRTSHSVRFTGEGGFEGERMLAGESWSHRFDRPGRHAYTCGPHPEMKGEIEVTP
jgi:plastocyanin